MNFLDEFEGKRKRKAGFFDLVIACDSQRGMSKNNALPWRLPAEVKYFRDLTVSVSDPALKNAVIMGRKTWQSLPLKFMPLPGRLNVVLSRDPGFPVPLDVLRCASLDQALDQLSSETVDRLFVIGGADVLRHAMSHQRCSLLYLTEIKQRFDCDTFLPEYEKLFRLLSSSEPQSETGIEYIFKVYERR